MFCALIRVEANLVGEKKCITHAGGTIPRHIYITIEPITSKATAELPLKVGFYRYL